jgi:hypothetical protein
VELFTIRFLKVKARNRKRLVEALPRQRRHNEYNDGLYRDILYFYHETVAIVLLFYRLFVLAKIDALKKFFLCFLMFSIRYSAMAALFLFVLYR